MRRDHPRHWMYVTAEIFADLSGPTNSILQRRMDMNTGVLGIKRQLSCARGAVVCVDDICYNIFWACVRTPSKLTLDILEMVANDV